MRETELKFSVPEQSLESVRRALRAEKVDKKRLQATYFDTGDWRLAEQHASLRLRREGRRWVQTAKAKTPDVMRRLEQNVPVAADGRKPYPDPMRHDGTSVGAVLRRALGKRRMRGGGMGLSPRFVTDVVRMKRTVRLPAAQVEIALDTGTIQAGDHALPVCELELELKSGAAAELTQLASQWVERHGLWLNVESKASRGLALAQEKTEPDAIKAEPADVASSVGGSAFFMATIESCLQQVTKNAGLAAEGHEGEEVVHQLRVGLRRLRTALRELEGIGAGIRPEWEPILRDVFQELGRQRDLTVVLGGIRKDLETVGPAPVPDPKPPQRTRRPATVVRETSFQTTLLELIALTALQERRDSTAENNGLPGFLAHRLDRLLRGIRKDAKRFDQLDVPRQHRVRKRLKRLRYLSEFAAPIFGSGKVDRYLAHWKKAQDALGDYNDQRIAIDLLGASDDGDSATSFALGWLQAQKRGSVQRCRKALGAAVDAQPFWE